MIKVVKKYTYPNKDEIKRMVIEAFNQDNKEDIIREIKYLKNR